MNMIYHVKNMNYSRFLMVGVDLP